MYADDTVLYFTSLCSLEINKVVQDDLNRVEKWIECNKLILNYSKTKTMLLEVGKILRNHQFFVYSYME